MAFESICQGAGGKEETERLDASNAIFSVSQINQSFHLGSRCSHSFCSLCAHFYTLACHAQHSPLCIGMSSFDPQKC